MSNQSHMANCSSLASRSDFASYVQELKFTTGFNVTLLEVCKGNICNALWGDGNADISGIGMVIGYFLDSVIGFCFALSLAFHEPFSTKPPLTTHGCLLAEGCKVYFDCAIFFAISIQIACLIVLVRRDFGISANGLGGFTVQITWAISLLCILPLLYPMFIMRRTNKDRKNYRLFLFCGCWLFFFYNFMFQMIGDFGPSQVGQGAGPGGTTIITRDEWNNLTSVCLSGVEYLSTAEQKVLSGFGATGSISITAYGLLSLLWFITTRRFPGAAKLIRPKLSCNFFQANSEQNAIWCVLFAVPLLTIPQLWGVLRLRGIQKGLADATSNVYVDNQWTFGQVVAVVIFIPVFTELGYLWMKKDVSCKLESLDDFTDLPG